MFSIDANCSNIKNYTIGAISLYILNLWYISRLFLDNNDTILHISTEFSRFCVEIHLLSTAFNNTVLINETRNYITTTTMVAHLHYLFTKWPRQIGLKAYFLPVTMRYGV